MVRCTACEVEGLLDIAALHDDNHRHSLTLGDSVVHDVLHLTLQHPAGLTLTHAMLQIQHRILLLAILILGRRINQSMAPLTKLRVGTVVVDATHLTMRNSHLRTVVVTLGTLGNFQATSLTVTTEVGLTGRIDEVDAIDIHKVIVEANRQWISDSHKAALTVRLHLIFLTANIYHDLTSLRGRYAEVGTALLVNLGGFIARDGILYGHSIGRNLNLLGNRHILGALGFETEVTGNSLSIAASQFTIACSIEVQAVRTIRAVVRRDDLTGMDGLGQFVNLLLTTNADALATSLNDVTYIKVYLFGLQLQVATEVLRHHTSPLGVTSIGLALVHQDTLDDTILLGLLGQLHQTLIGVVVVSGQHTLHPTWSLLLSILFDAIRQETLDINTTDSHMDDANSDVIGCRSHHRATKPVGRSQTRVWTTQGC